MQDDFAMEPLANDPTGLLSPFGIRVFSVPLPGKRCGSSSRWLAGRPPWSSPVGRFGQTPPPKSVTFTGTERDVPEDPQLMIEKTYPPWNDHDDYDQDHHKRILKTARQCPSITIFNVL